MDYKIRIEEQRVKKERNMFHIGSHISSSKGYAAMGRQAVKLGADTFAFFTRNPRGGSAKAVQQADVDKYLETAKEHKFAQIVAHAPYTLNACAVKEEIRTFARGVFADDLQRMEYIPGQYYNFHPGSHVGQGVEKGIEWIAGMLNENLRPEQSTTVLLETMAGKGSEVGKNFEELRAIIDRIELSDKLGVCLDTCHVWDSGYDIVNNLDGVLEEFEHIIGLERLKAIHINDSMNPMGSHKDRHARIGEGTIGLEAFRRIVRHPLLQDIPFILETPNDDAGWAGEIAMLRKMAEEK